mgnify:CR=1 FL=1
MGSDAEQGKNRRNLFKPGQSGNPKGRPKLPPELKDFKTAMKSFASTPAYITAVMKHAIKGHPKALEMVAHYGAGKPADTLNVTQESYESYLKRAIEKEKNDATTQTSDG